MAKNLFATKTFQGATLALVAGLAPIAITCFYDSRYPTKQEAIAGFALLVTFGWTLIGRIETSPVYTPKSLPGPNQADFE